MTLDAPMIVDAFIAAAFPLVMLVGGVVYLVHIILTETLVSPERFRKPRTPADDAERERFLRTYQYKDRAK